MHVEHDLWKASHGDLVHDLSDGDIHDAHVSPSAPKMCPAPFNQGVKLGMVRAMGFLATDVPQHIWRPRQAILDIFDRHPTLSSIPLV